MGDYVEEGLSKSHEASTSVSAVLAPRESVGDGELRHGAWIQKARARLRVNPFGSARFALLAVFLVLYVGSVFLFESMDIISGPLYAIKITISSLFAVSLGVILSLWWQSMARFDEKIREAQRLDAEYRELLLSFSDSLFDIINALNTLASKPPRPFVIATEFLLGEYVHLLQSQLQRYGDYVAGLGFDATDFLDEKIRIFEGIRERASLSIQGMPKEIGNIFVEGLSLNEGAVTDVVAKRQERLQTKLQELAEAHNAEASAEDAAATSDPR
jgi:hypothetical protein